MFHLRSYKLNKIQIGLHAEMYVLEDFKNGILNLLSLYTANINPFQNSC